MKRDIKLERIVSSVSKQAVILFARLWLPRVNRNSSRNVNSVTSLDYFWNVWARNFRSKVAKIIGQLFGLFWKITLFNSHLLWLLRGLLLAIIGLIFIPASGHTEREEEQEEEEGKIGLHLTLSRAKIKSRFGIEIIAKWTNKWVST